MSLVKTTESHMQQQPRTIRARFQVRYLNKRGKEFSLDVDLNLPATGITAIFGHSGSGKTTLLRCFAGLEKNVKGELCVFGNTWQTNDDSLATHKRPIGYVFQEASLFPHLNAEQNIQFAIKRSIRKCTSEQYEKVISVMGIENILASYPQQLSGGERQRVAIARALLIQPELLLMDEPLASLDQKRKQEILPYLENLHAISDVPILYVSHSMDEVARLADHVVALEHGKVVAQGSLSDVFSRIDIALTDHESAGVILQCKVEEKDDRWHLMRVAFEGGELWVRDSGDKIGQHIRIRILARDVSIAMSCQTDSSILNRLAVVVDEIIPDQDESMSMLKLRSGNDYIVARITNRSHNQLALKEGGKVWAQVKSVAVIS
ncbi:MAG: molybdenum ABC transporter ATP-binding protein [Kangiellaceae bacterium]|nr:molybdenum ABC transporter ATP-binding protein [Kangiellaceae bacterium]